MFFFWVNNQVRTDDLQIHNLAILPTNLYSPFKLVLWITNNHHYFFTPSRLWFLPVEAEGLEPT